MKSIWTALRDRHCPPAWAYFEEVRNGTGFVRKVTRSADALAFSLYPSRGLELHGFEVKVSRGDWLREKDDPNKAEEIARFCERWWLVTTKGCVNDVNEIPPSWGWLEFNGKLLVQKKPAPPMAAQPLDKPMVAAILRKASEGQNARVSESLTEQINERMAHERQVAIDRDTLLEKSRAETDEINRRAMALIRQLEQAVGQRLFAEGSEISSGARQLVAEIHDVGLAREAQPLDELGRKHLEQLGRVRNSGVRSEKPRRGGW